MTGSELRRWQQAHGIGVEQLASVLAVSRRSVFRWRNGDRVIPRVVVLALPAARKQLGARRRASASKLRAKREAWAAELDRRERERQERSRAIQERHDRERRYGTHW